LIHKEIRKGFWVLGNWDSKRGYKFRGYWEMNGLGPCRRCDPETGITLSRANWVKHLWKPRGLGRRPICRRCGETKEEK